MRKLSLLLFAIALMTSCDDEVNGLVMPTDGLVAYYTLNNEAEDKSGNTNNGQIIGATGTTDRKDEANGALLFNGTDSKVKTNTTIDNSLSNGLTFSAWIYFTGNGVGRILSNYNGEGTPGDCNERVGFTLSVRDGNTLSLAYAIDGNDYIGRITPTNSISPNQWIHVLGTWDGTYQSSGFKLYIDNVQKDTNNHSEGSVACGSYKESSYPFHIGMGLCSSGECHAFTGKIDDLRIYSKVLNNSERELLSKEE